MPPKTAVLTVTQAYQAFELNMGYIKNAVINYNKLGVDNQNSAVTQGRLQLIHNYWESCELNPIFINQNVTEEERKELQFFKDDLLAAAEQHFLTAYDFFQNKLATFAAPASSNTVSVGGSSSNEIQLPKIKLPSFSGKLVEWVSFRDQFVGLVKNRTTLSNVQKLQYLLSATTDEAAKLISDISLTDNNFNVAWTALNNNRYENERVIIDAHLNRFCSIPNVTFNSIIGLKQLRADSFESTNALRVLKCPVDEWNNILVHLLTQKLDKLSRQEWEFYLGSDKTYPKLDKFNSFLETRIRALEATSTPNIADASKNSNAKANTSNSNFSS